MSISTTNDRDDMSSGLNIEVSPYTMRPLTKENSPHIQDFLYFFDDFFMLCEGERGSANGLLSACPPGKGVKIDKIFMGIYSEDILIGIIDLIKDYPEDEVWTIGYLLIHPDYRGQKIGSKIINAVFKTKSIKKFRCVVQNQNPRALNFWQKLGFIITNELKEQLRNIESDVYILEREV